MMDVWCLDSDDEEGPFQKTKVEAFDEQGLFTIPAFQKEYDDPDASKTETENHSAIAPPNNTDGKAGTRAELEASNTAADTRDTVPAPIAKQKGDEKEKKRKAILADLEDFELQRKINQAKRALWELEEE